MLDNRETGLILVDMQGKLANLVDESDELADNCVKLVTGCQQLGLPILWLEQNPSKLGETIAPLRALLAQQQPISKFSFDACLEPNFINAIKQSDKESWLICGIEAHICVYQTAVQLHALGYEAHLVADCISSRKVANKTLAINEMRQRGIRVTGLEMCLYELIKDCRSPLFKQILSLVK